MSREVLRDAVIYLPAKVIPAAVGLLAIPIFTRMMSLAQYGQYILVSVSLAFISSFCISWLISITIRFSAAYGVVTLFRICRPLLIGSVLLGCFSWIGVTFLLGGTFATSEFVWIGIVWLVAQGGFEYLVGWLRARSKAKAYSLAISWRSVAGLLTAVTFLTMGFPGEKGVILGAALAMLAALTVLPRVALRPDCDEPSVVEKASVARIAVLRYGIPAAFINLATVGLSLADRYIIGALMGAEAVAIYSASYTIAEQTVFFANSMLLLSSSVIGFRIFEQEGEVKAAKFLTRLMRLYLLVAPPLVVGLAIFSRDIVAILLPAKYGEGSLVLPIVALGGLFVGIAHRYSLLLSFHKRTDTILWCSAISLVVNLISCVLLIPAWGLIGAALSTLFAYAAWLILLRVAASKYIGPSFPWLTLLRVIVALIVGSCVIHICEGAIASAPQVFLLAALLLGLFFYLVTLYALGEITRKDLIIIGDSLTFRLKT